MKEVGLQVTLFPCARFFTWSGILAFLLLLCAPFSKAESRIFTERMQDIDRDGVFTCCDYYLFLSCLGENVKIPDSCRVKSAKPTDAFCGVVHSNVVDDKGNRAEYLLHEWMVQWTQSFKKKGNGFPLSSPVRKGFRFEGTSESVGVDLLVVDDPEKCRLRTKLKEVRALGGCFPPGSRSALCGAKISTGGRFTWVFDRAHVGSGPFEFTFEVEEDNPPGIDNHELSSKVRIEDSSNLHPVLCQQYRTGSETGVRFGTQWKLNCP